MICAVFCFLCHPYEETVIYMYSDRFVRLAVKFYDYFKIPSHMTMRLKPISPRKYVLMLKYDLEINSPSSIPDKSALSQKILSGSFTLSTYHG